MKNKFKKLLAFAIFAIMTMAMAVTAMATEPGSQYKVTITADGANVKNTYKVYQIATFDVETVHNGNETETVYTNIKVTDAYKGVFNPATAKTITSNTTNADELAKTLAGVSASAYTTTNNGEFYVGATGYYLVKETAHSSNDAYLATKYILVPVDANNKTVTLKTSQASITKKIVLEGSEDTLVDKNVAAVGDIVTYQLEATIPEYPSSAIGLSYVITDVLSNGLTYQGVTSIKIKKSTEEAYADVNGSDWVRNNGQTTTITVPEKTVKENPGGTIRIRLTARLNSGANKGAKGNPNSVDLKYTNNWDVKDSYYETPKDTVITYTGVLNIIKTDDAQNAEAAKPLQGAEFAIYAPKQYSTDNGADVWTDEGKASHVTETIRVDGTTYYYYKMVTTGADGKASVEGLDSGKYYAVENKAPAGYNIVTTPKEISLTVEGDRLEVIGDSVASSTKIFEEANNDAVKSYDVSWKTAGYNELRIENTKGNTLPGTGGMGTTIFTIGGIVLVALAALMFVVYMRKQKKQA